MPDASVRQLEEAAELLGVSRSSLVAEFVAKQLPERLEEAKRLARRNAQFDVRTVPLDGLLWATARTVSAGSINDAGQFMVNPLRVRNSVDQLLLAADGNTEGYWAPRIDELDRPDEVRRFQQTVADMIVFGLLVDKQVRTGRDAFVVARAHELFQDRWRFVCRALDIDTSGDGAEWVPTGVGAAMHERVRAVGKVAPLFSRVQMPSGLWKWPLEGADAQAYRVGEPTSDTATKVGASTPGTGGATFDAEILGARVLFSKSLDADSAVSILPFVQNKIIKAFVNAEEKAILDGDTDGTHQDSDTHAAGSTDARWAWDGLRKRALANGATVDASDGELTSARLGTVRAAMGRYGLAPEGLVIIAGPSSYYSLLGDSNVLTVDKYGPDATILHGEIGRVWGIPIVVSEHVRENLNASGVHDGITTSRTYGLVVSTSEWAMGMRQPLTLEVDDSLYRESYQRAAFGFSRQDFQNINADGSSAKDTGIVLNINITG